MCLQTGCVICSTIRYILGTPFASNYKKFYHYSDPHVSGHVLVFMFTHFNLYAVLVEISRTSYNSEPRVKLLCRIVYAFLDMDLQLGFFRRYADGNIFFYVRGTCLS
jgi:hypothetical protein